VPKERKRGPLLNGQKNRDLRRDRSAHWVHRIIGAMENCRSTMGILQNDPAHYINCFTAPECARAKASISMNEYDL